jgi:hypothetical protein
MTPDMEIPLTQHICPTHPCGINFWTSNDFDSRRRIDKRDFYCPNGHSIAYQGETDAQKLARVTFEKNKEIANLTTQLAAKTRRKRRSS